MSDVDETVEKLTKLVKQFNTPLQNSNTFIELEAKFGYVNDRGWCPGVSQTNFKKMVETLSQGGAWERVDRKIHTEDYFYNDSIRETRKPDGKSIFIVKRPGSVVEVPHNNMVIRFATKKEIGCSSKLISNHNPRFVRIKMRTSYIFQRSPTKPRWRYDFTMVWSGSTGEIARSHAPTFEVEIECEDTCGCEPEYVARSLRAKMNELADMIE